MFKDKYKEAHNKIVPDKELLQKIIATADYELKKKNEKALAKLAKDEKHKKISFYPYLYAAAAVMVIATSLTAYNALNPNDNRNYGTLLQTENESEEKNEIKLSEKNEVANIPEEKTKKTDEAVQEVHQAEKAQEAQEAREIKKVQNAQDATFSPEAEEEKIDSVKVLWNVNNITPDTAVQSRSVPLIASHNEDMKTNESLYEEISKEEYESYIGFSPEEKAAIPEDMKLYPTDNFVIEKDSQTGEILNDENTYYFESSFDRFIMITTTKKTNEIDSFLNNENYQKSVINDENVVITLNESIYNAYLKRNDTGIKLTAGKIEEKELKNTIKSLLE